MPQDLGREIARRVGFSGRVTVLTGAGVSADPLRVQVLRALGGLHVVTVHRRGRDSLEGRTPDLTRLLGADERTIASLYALDQPDSSLAAALRSAAGVWCTNWDAFDELDVDGLFADGYLAPLRTADPYFLWRRDPYPGASPDVDFVGCGPGELAANP